MVVISLWDILVLIAILIAIIALFIKFMRDWLCARWYKGLFKYKKPEWNCYNCYYYKLDDVAPYGDHCWYKCTKHNRRDSTTMNCRKHYEKCSDFSFKEDI